MLTLAPTLLKWILRSYPPFVFQRIWVKKIYPNYMGADVKIYRSLLNINGNKSIFGGTIFAATDPLHPLLIDQIFKSKGYKRTVTWVKSAHIEYKKPGLKNLEISIRISEAEVQEALETIASQGKMTKVFTIEIHDINGTLCAVSKNEIYIRNLLFDFSTIEAETSDRVIDAIKHE